MNFFEPNFDMSQVALVIYEDNVSLELLSAVYLVQELEDRVRHDHEVLVLLQPLLHDVIRVALHLIWVRENAFLLQQIRNLHWSWEVLAVFADGWCRLATASLLSEIKRIFDLRAVDLLHFLPGEHVEETVFLPFIEPSCGNQVTGESLF